MTRNGFGRNSGGTDACRSTQVAYTEDRPPEKARLRPAKRTEGLLEWTGAESVSEEEQHLLGGGRTARIGASHGGGTTAF